MTGMPSVLQVDPLCFPLQGSHLIEASAGTGKTWTIAALYVRLVLGHGGQPPRLPQDILVLTFTEAAAQELRDRIRSRLAQAALAFLGAEGAAEDPFLAALRDAYPAERRAACARVLDLAAQSMDEAVISTIHAWCARVLQQHAFDGAALFEQTLQPDLSAQKRRVAWDYWRACVAPLGAAAMEAIAAVWSGPEDMLPLTAFLTQDGIPLGGEGALGEVVEDALAARAARLRALKAPWKSGADQLGDWLESLGKDWAVQPRHWRSWVRTLRDWAADDDQETLSWTPTAWLRLSSADMADKWRGDGPPPAHPLCDALAELRLALDAVPALDVPVRAHALGWMAARLRRVLADGAMMGFDGLLTELDEALAHAPGDHLAGALRQQFPAVLVDEFQDTDPVQYRIFDRIYQVADNRLDSLLIFIGDPKQAIYGFRGADVHTYLRAARSCGPRVHTLDRNFRSTEAMVAAVNACFQAGESPVFPTGLADRSIAFHPVRATGRDEHWLEEGRPGCALGAVWIDPPESGKDLTVAQYGAQAAAHCAQRIARLLDGARRGGTGLSGADGMRPLQPADIAVLVNRRQEAELVRAALARSGVRSVYLSERDSVYESPQAAELALCLAACADPEDDRALRAALATPLLGLGTAALHDLAQDEWAWDAQVERFQGYRQCWQKRGVLPVVRRLLLDFGVAGRFLARGHAGERALTDCLHLAELLQEAAAHLDGEQALLRHLHQQIQTPQGEDARRLRLESDENLVKVVTVHKAKGLEYPLVFLPFVCCAPAGGRGHGPCRLPAPQGGQWVMEPDPEQRDCLARERLGEEVRKLYVALTRARHAVWLALGPLRGQPASGISHVLGDDLHGAWDALAARLPGCVAWFDPSPGAAPLQSLAGAVRPESGAGGARRLKRPVVGEAWWIASYSALHLAGTPLSARPAVAAPDTAVEDVLIEARRADAIDEASAFAEVNGSVSPLGDFPRGSSAGTFLHGILEWAGQERFTDLEPARDVIARRCAVRGWEAHIEPLHDWLRQFVSTVWRPDLPERPQFRLDELDVCLPEMEFWLPAAEADLERLDAIITQSLFPGRIRPALAPGRLNGMFKGFIDLVFQAQGRYYVIDYKSNDLGDQPEHYGREALAAVMCAARYDVQLMMYVLALHRQLKARLPGYDYARDMGGAIYCFLRGQGAPGQGLVAVRPPLASIEALDALLAGDSNQWGERHGS